MKGANGVLALGGTEIMPVFRGSIDPDMTFFGFAFTKEQATAGLGYYFVLAEHPSEPRFGFELGRRVLFHCKTGTISAGRR